MRNLNLKIHLGIILLVMLLYVGVASATIIDEPVLLRETFVGPLEFFATGGPLALDTNLNNNVDTISSPSTVTILGSDIASDAKLVRAFLYWGGTVAQPAIGDCMAGAIDNQVIFTAPGGTPSMITADLFYCSDAGSTNVDMQTYRADVSSQIGSLIGTYSIDGFTALISDGGIDNASFSLEVIS